MEPTGMAWFPVAAWLARAGIEVIRVKGKRVRALRRYLSEHAKTDATDAHVLAALPHFGGPALDPVFVPNPEQHALQRLTKRRERLQVELCSGKRRLLDLIRWACPAVEAALPDLATCLSRALLAAWLDPHCVLSARPRTLAAFVARHAAGNHPHTGPFVDALVDRLRAAARETLALHGDAVDFQGLQFEVQQEIVQLRLLDGQVADLERRIDELYARLHPSDALRTIPGIGPRIAPVLLGVLHEAPNGSAANGTPVASAASSRPAARRVGWTSLGSGSPSPATTGSRERCTSLRMRRGGSTRDWPRSTGG